MGVVTSPKEQRRIAEAARRVGGYEHLARLASEKRTAGVSSKVRYDDIRKQWTYRSESPKGK